MQRNQPSVMLALLSVGGAALLVGAVGGWLARLYVMEVGVERRTVNLRGRNVELRIRRYM